MSSAGLCRKTVCVCASGKSADSIPPALGSVEVSKFKAVHIVTVPCSAQPLRDGHKECNSEPLPHVQAAEYMSCFLQRASNEHLSSYKLKSKNSKAECPLWSPSDIATHQLPTEPEVTLTLRNWQ